MARPDYERLDKMQQDAEPMALLVDYRPIRADVRRLEDALRRIVAIAEEFDGAVKYAGEIALEALGE